MNPTERAYSEWLEGLRLTGEIRSWEFEAVKLRLARATFYTPDFLVEGHDGRIELHEVKGGYIREDAALKLKMAAKLFPCFQFVKAVGIKKRGAFGWTFTRL